MAPRQRQLSPSVSLSSDDGRREAEPLVPSTKGPTTTTMAPLMLETREDAAREKHDLFNILALLVVVASTLIDWDLRKLALGYGPATAYRGDFFWVNWATTVAYFFIDLVWVASVPICVKSPGTIIKHHVVAIAYLSGPVLWPEYRWFMGACLSVELNTWFLILRRVVFKRQDKINKHIIHMISQAFYISWIIIRCFLYPAILAVFLQMAHQEIKTTQIVWHWPMLFIPVHFCLCLLNLKWSYELFQPIVSRWMGTTPDGVNIDQGISKGL